MGIFKIFDNVFDAVFNFKQEQDTNTVKAQNFTISSVTSGLVRQPIWVSRYPICDVTYPEALLSGWFVTATTGAQTAGTAHTHPISLSSSNAAGGIMSVASQDESIGAYVTISQTLVIDTVGMWIRKALSSPSLNNVYIEIFKENADTSLTRVWVSSDISGSCSTSITWLSVTVSPGLLVHAGDRYLVRVRNSSSNLVNVGPAGILKTAISPDSVFYTFTGDTAQTSYTDTEAATARAATNIFPFIVLAATSLSATDQSFSDDFNRSQLGGLWTTKSNTTTDLLTVNGSQASYNGTTNGNQNALVVRQMNGDKNYVEAAIYGTLDSTAHAYLGVLMHCNSDFSSIMYLAVNDQGAKIYSGSTTSLTQRATITRDFNDGLWRLQYDPSTTTYTAYMDGNDVGLSWNDSGAAKPRGALYRYGGLRIERASGVNAGTMDDFTLADWA